MHPTTYPTTPDSSAPPVEQTYPFLLFDRILSQDATQVIAQKCITQNEWMLTATPQYPFWCLLESLAQSAGILDRNLQQNTSYPNRVLSRIRRARYYRALHAGDTVELHVRLLKQWDRYAAYQGEAHCGGQRRGWAEMYFFHF